VPSYAVNTESLTFDEEASPQQKNISNS